MLLYFGGFFDPRDARFSEVFLDGGRISGLIGVLLGQWGIFLDDALFVFSCGKSYFFLFHGSTRGALLLGLSDLGLFDGLAVSSDGSIHSIGWWVFRI